MSAADVQPRLS